MLPGTVGRTDFRLLALVACSLCMMAQTGCVVGSTNADSQFGTSVDTFAGTSVDTFDPVGEQADPRDASEPMLIAEPPSPVIAAPVPSTWLQKKNAGAQPQFPIAQANGEANPEPTSDVAPVLYAEKVDDFDLSANEPQKLAQPETSQQDDSQSESLPSDGSETDVFTKGIENAFAVSADNGTQIVPVQYQNGRMPYADAIGSYRIEIGDQVNLKFLYRQDLNETLIVGDDGMIDPSITPSVLAAGKTTFELKQELAEMIAARRYDSRSNLYDDNRSVEYLIAVDDQIEVRFSVLEDLNDTVTVRPDGKISLARIGEVTAEGKTPSDLQAELIERYEDKIRQAELVVIMRETTSPNVYVDGTAVPLPLKGISEFTVSVIKTAPRLVYIMGEVNRPSAVPFQPELTALRAIGSSGGTKRSANLKHVLIIRNSGGCGIEEFAVDLRPCRKVTYGIDSHTDGGFADFDLRPNDVVLIPKTKIAKVQDWLDQYVYNLFPPLRNSSVFSVIYNQGIPGFNTP